MGNVFSQSASKIKALFSRCLDHLLSHKCVHGEHADTPTYTLPLKRIHTVVNIRPGCLSLCVVDKHTHMHTHRHLFTMVMSSSREWTAVAAWPCWGAECNANPAPTYTCIDVHALTTHVFLDTYWHTLTKTCWFVGVLSIMLLFSLALSSYTLDTLLVTYVYAL